MLSREFDAGMSLITRGKYGRANAFLHRRGILIEGK
jgi:hypothetical protein